MLSQFKKSFVLIPLLAISVSTHAEEPTKNPETTAPQVPSETDEFVEIQTSDGKSFLVNTKNLIKIQEAAQVEEKTSEASAPTTKVENETKTEIKSETKTEVKAETKTETQLETEPKKEVANPIITNTTSDKKEVSVIETKVENKVWDGTTKTEDTTVKETKENNVIIETKTKTVKPSTEPLLLPDPAVTETTTTVPTNPEVLHEATTTKVATTYNKPKRFSVRSAIGYGSFTTISDINSTYSFGFGLGYDITRRLNVELQYIFSEFEDTYNYGYGGGYAYDSKFGQNDIAVILNYKVLPKGPFKINLRGGLNYSYRSVRDSYWGYSDSSNALAAIIGIGADFHIANGIFITGNIDYNLNLNDSGYSYEPSPLDLVAGENYVNFNIGVKFKF